MASNSHRIIITIYAIILLPLTMCAGGGGLKWVRVNLPHFRRPGEAAHLHCDYDLGNDTLYAVKWYKDNEEFYRFVAKERPQSTSHKVDGVDVDLSLSSNKKVVLRTVRMRSGGMYKCEVSAEAPSFASAQSEARLEVISLPNEDPKITGVKVQYQIGDEINLNCTSGRSYPASMLYWYINEQKITSNSLLIKYPTRKSRQGLLTTVLGLRFHLSDRHFPGGSMRVKCIASISRSDFDDRTSVIENLPITDLREALLLVRNTGSEKSIIPSLINIIVLFALIYIN